MNWRDRWILEEEEQLARVDEEFKDPGVLRLGAFTGASESRFANIRDMIETVRGVWENIDEFYAPLEGFTVQSTQANVLELRSAVAENHSDAVVRAQFFGWRKPRRRAVIIVPHWNATLGSYAAMSTALSWFGFAVFVITLPHHEGRRGSSAAIANEFLNANLGAAISSVRQAVSEVRALIGWLRQAGFEDVALVGVSLGSCIAGLVAAVDGRVRRAALLLTAGDFAETVWTGRATSHIRSAIGSGVTLSDLRKVWSIISTINFVDRYKANKSKLLIISGRLDQVVLIRLSREFVVALRAAGVAVEWRILSCGHYTLGHMPYSFISVFRVIRFLRRR